MANEKIIGWGKCSVTVPPASGTATTYDDIVEGSASLSREEGDEMEALIEGGEAEARKKRPTSTCSRSTAASAAQPT